MVFDICASELGVTIGQDVVFKSEMWLARCMANVAYLIFTLGGSIFCYRSVRPGAN